MGTVVEVERPHDWTHPEPTGTVLISFNQNKENDESNILRRTGGLKRCNFARNKEGVPKAGTETSPRPEPRQQRVHREIQTNWRSLRMPQWCNQTKRLRCSIEIWIAITESNSIEYPIHLTYSICSINIPQTIGGSIRSIWSLVSERSFLSRSVQGFGRWVCNTLSK